MSLIVGIDASFSCTGLSIYDSDAETTVCRSIKSGTSHGHHGQRCTQIADTITMEVFEYLAPGAKTIRPEQGMTFSVPMHPMDFFIESPCGQFRGEANDMPALYWIIVNTIQRTYPEQSVYPVSPNELFKFLTGKGRTPRVNKVVAVQKKYGHLIPEEFVVDYDTPGGIEKHADVYDSIGLAVLGDCVLHPEKFSQSQREAVKKIRRL